MKLEIIVQDAAIITKKSSPYNINGHEGISYKCDILHDNDVAKIAFSEDAFAQIDMGKSYNLLGELYLTEKRSSLKIIGIVD